MLDAIDLPRNMRGHKLDGYCPHLDFFPSGAGKAQQPTAAIDRRCSNMVRWGNGKASPVPGDVEIFWFENSANSDRARYYKLFSAEE
jgi:hypothetical protein